MCENGSRLTASRQTKSNGLNTNLQPLKKKSLKEIEAKDLLLADAFRDTLAARLTATRILKSSKHELLLVERRRNKLKYLKSENSTNLQEELKTDREKLSKIKSDAEEMRVEAETRLQMIEAAARRGGNVADTELALKKLSARTAELPLALESAKMEDEIRKEFEKELEKREVWRKKIIRVLSSVFRRLLLLRAC